MKLMEWTATYDKMIGNHKFNILGGYSYEQDDYESMNVSARGFITDIVGANDLESASTLNPGDAESSKTQSRLISFYARANYSFKERYLLTATIRRDGSSKFGKNNKWGTFPSVSAGWVISEEPFMKNIHFINNLKITAGYGLNGNQAGLEPYNTLELFGSSGYYYNSGNWLPAYQISQNPNPDLKWETTAMLNIGLDFALLDNRLSGRIEWYNKKTSDMLYSYPAPTPPYMYSTIMANVGDMRNRGIEFNLNAGIIRNENFSWDISLNLSHNKNKIVHLSDDVYTMDRVMLGSLFIRGGDSFGTHILEEGRPVGQFYGLECTGLDENGRYIFVDQDGSGDISSPDDYTYIGNAQPDLSYGITNTFKYKNWDFSFFLYGTIGNDVLNAARAAYAQSGFLPGSNALDDEITFKLSEVPIISSFYIEDASFLRLDNLSLGYTFPKLWNGIRLYFAAQNLFVITKYKGLDPEVDMSGLTPSVEYREFYPKSRTFSFGMNLNF
jgi:iron complex outermembrane receptor protein